jgi:hypothetical protein
MEQGIRIRTVVILWLSMFVVSHSNAQDYSTWGEIYDYEVGDIFHFRDEAETTFWTGYIKLTIVEIISKYYSTNNDTVFYGRWIESAYIDSGNPYWVFDSHYDTVSYTNLSSFCIADSVYSSTAYNGRQVSYVEYINQHPYYYWRKFVNGCGRAVYYYEEAWPYPYFGYWEQRALKYFKKGDEKWGTPLTIVGIEEQSRIYQDVKVYPNPFTTSTAIEFTLDGNSKIQISIFNSIGELVYQFEDQFGQGSHAVTWSPGHLPEGMYFAVLKTEEGLSVVKMLKR